MMTIWRDVALALVMALGLTSAFFLPMRSPTATPAEGRVLGAETAGPLTVTVNVHYDTQTVRLDLQPVPATVTNVLAMTAAAMRSSFSYTSRGSAIYLQRFLGQADDASGVWAVQWNGQLLTDLSQLLLGNGDELTIIRQRP